MINNDLAVWDIFNHWDDLQMVILFLSCQILQWNM